MLTRRNFLATVGALAGAAACRPYGAAPAGVAGGAASRRRLDKVGIQLYSVRDVLPKDFDGTLRRLAEIGYRKVEFAGYFGHSPAAVRATLEQVGLTAPSTHVDYASATGDTDRVLDTAAAIGHEFVTLAWIDPSARRSLDDWRRIADTFNRVGERARARGARFAYHNHDFELKAIDGVVPLDLLLERTDPALVSFEMDIYWVTFGGGNPQEYIKKNPARFAMLHVKDSAGPPKNAQVDVGAGTIDFASILRLDADQRHAVKHVFVEHDQPADPMAFAKNSFDYLSRVEF